MYDLNLLVPDLTSQKYSSDSRFLLLKNYLYELNDALAVALSDKNGTVAEGLLRAVESNKNEEKENIIRLKKQSLQRFEELKANIIRTAEEIELAYTTEISKSQEEILSTAQGLYATKTELGEYKNQVETQLSQTAEEIELNATATEEIKTDLESFKKSSNAELSLQAQEIISQVEGIYSAKTDLAELEEEISSRIVQSSTAVTEAFSERLSLVNDDLSSVGGRVSELVSSLDVYIRRGELEEGVYGIEIGRSDSLIKARFTNDRLSFMQGGGEIAYVSGSNLYITRAEILDYLKIGNALDGYFTFDTTQNGLEVIWTDGN